ncbi:serine/threonine-protein kinase RsbW [freshwater sediment metagenome]|jgi:serine/threonine-protein kinase RsbW|uniref:Serine/threonine-protein kinase RsbW n=1 Tax=freshwater sediment metagenome TaxID=556182 RepID=A0AA48M0V1_9ZZZZ
MMSETSMNVDIVVPNQTRYLRLIGNIAEQIAKELEADAYDQDTLAYHLNLVLTEAVANAIEYAGSKRPDETVKVCLSIADKEILIRVYDHGQGFDIARVPPPDVDHLSERGRGIFFIRNLMDSVDYRKADDGNVLEMRKTLK